MPDALFDLTPALTRELVRKPDMGVIEQPATPLPDGWIRLDLPRWDTAWEAKRDRRGWPKVDPKTHKVVKHRKVWDALRGNARPGHFAVRHKAVREVIHAVVDAARRAGLGGMPRCAAHLTVQLVWAPGDHRRADDDNLWQLQKVCCDGLARGPQGKRPTPGLRLVPDDTRKYMTKLAPRIDRPPEGQTGPSGLWLEVTPE